MRDFRECCLHSSKRTSKTSNVFEPSHFWLYLFCLIYCMVKERWTHNCQTVRAQGDGGNGGGSSSTSEQICQGWKAGISVAELHSPLESQRFMVKQTLIHTTVPTAAGGKTGRLNMLRHRPSRGVGTNRHKLAVV